MDQSDGAVLVVAESREKKKERERRKEEINSARLTSANIFAVSLLAHECLYLISRRIARGERERERDTYA